jgi:hypothetical protein
VDVARPELGREAVALRVEDEEGVIADGFKVALYADCSCAPWTGLSELSISSVTRRFGDRIAACSINAVFR